MEYLRIYHFAGMKSSKINELFYKHVSKWPKVLSDYGIYIFVSLENFKRRRKKKT
jgi:hypothetical protein